MILLILLGKVFHILLALYGIELRLYFSVLGLLVSERLQFWVLQIKYSLYAPSLSN